MIAVPLDFPLSTPVDELIMATEVSLLVQLPPPVVSKSVIVVPMVTLVNPVIVPIVHCPFEDTANRQVSIKSKVFFINKRYLVVCAIKISITFSLNRKKSQTVEKSYERYNTIKNSSN